MSASSSQAQYVPQRKKNSNFRTIVMLFDGTGNKDGEYETNVIMLRNMLQDDKDKPVGEQKQLVFYQPGIGTYNPYVTVTIPFVSQLSRSLDGAIAWSLRGHLIDSYQWLMKNYRPGDKISLFGFSRGAYTARALAGMINSWGLLPDMEKEKAKKLCHECYDIFSRELTKVSTKESLEKSQQEWDRKYKELEAFRTRNASREDVFIDFLGCWDTVNSVGTIRAIKLPYTANNDMIRVGRHALALDERRVRFKANMLGYGPVYGRERRLDTDTLEVWFSGCHADVGGGSVDNDVRPNLALIPMRWMVRECFKTNTDIIFNVERMRVVGLDLNPTTFHPRSRDLNELIPQENAQVQIYNPGSLPYRIGSWLYSFIPFTGSKPVGALGLPNDPEAVLDAQDALAPLYDQLALHPEIWEALEVAPLRTNVYQPRAKDDEPKYIEQRQLHLNAGRTISVRGNKDGKPGTINVHKSVLLRMEAEISPSKKYHPNALILDTSIKDGQKHFQEKLPFDTRYVKWVI